MNALWLVVAALVALWILGVAFKLFGAVIHVLLVAAAVLCVVSLATGFLSGRRLSR